MSQPNAERFTSFSTFAANLIGHQDNALTETAVAGVLYNNRQSLALINEEPFQNEYKLKAYDFNQPTEKGLRYILDGGGMIQSLPQLETTKLGQIEVSSPILTSSPSVYSPRDEISFRFDFRDIRNDKMEHAQFSEAELLRVFTGEAGGFLVFNNAGLPQEVAMVIDKKIADIRLGLMYFFHSAEGHQSMPSMIVFREFVEGMFKGLSDQKNSPQLTNTAELLEKYGSQFEKAIENPVRFELFKARILASARMFDITENDQYLRFVNMFLSDWEPNEEKSSGFFIFGNKQEKSESLKNDDKKTELTAVVDKLLIGANNLEDIKNLIPSSDERLTKKGPALTPEGEIVVCELRDRDLKSLRLLMDPYIYLEENQEREAMWAYLGNLLNLAKLSGYDHQFRENNTWFKFDSGIHIYPGLKTSDQASKVFSTLEDVEVLLNELLESPAKTIHGEPNNFLYEKFQYPTPRGESYPLGLMTLQTKLILHQTRVILINSAPHCFSEQTIRQYIAVEDVERLLERRVDLLES